VSSLESPEAALTLAECIEAEESLTLLRKESCPEPPLLIPDWAGPGFRQGLEASLCALRHARAPVERLLGQGLARFRDRSFVTLAHNQLEINRTEAYELARLADGLERFPFLGKSFRAGDLFRSHAIALLQVMASTARKGVRQMSGRPRGESRVPAGTPWGVRQMSGRPRGESRVPAGTPWGVRQMSGRPSGGSRASAGTPWDLRQVSGRPPQPPGPSGRGTIGPGEGAPTGHSEATPWHPQAGTRLPWSARRRGSARRRSGTTSSAPSRAGRERVSGTLFAAKRVPDTLSRGTTSGTTPREAATRWQTSHAAAPAIAWRDEPMNR